MSIQDSDKLLVGRDNSSFQIPFSQSGIALKSDYVSKYGETIDDAAAPVTYEWNKDLNIKTSGNFKLERGGCSIRAFADEDDDELMRLTAPYDITLASDQISFNANEKILCRSSDYVEINGYRQVRIGSSLESIFLNASNGGERIERTISETDHAKQITNKEYVDNNFMPLNLNTLPALT